MKQALKKWAGKVKVAVMAQPVTIGGALAAAFFVGFVFGGL